MPHFKRSSPGFVFNCVRYPFILSFCYHSVKVRKLKRVKFSRNNSQISIFYMGNQKTFLCCLFILFHILIQIRFRYIDHFSIFVIQILPFKVNEEISIQVVSNHLFTSKQINQHYISMCRKIYYNNYYFYGYLLSYNVKSCTYIGFNDTQVRCSYVNGK